ncbi:MAG: OmpH family outer membrane protein [Magnetococcales bacterium]|nr:OmpH family outer membrane protein [Magnetococcales bacterium]
MAAANVKFAYVDVPRVMASSEAGKRARELLKQKLAVKQKEVTAMEANINKMKENLEQRKSLMTPESRSELAGKIRRKFREFQRLVEDNQAAVDRENRRWTKKLTETLREVIEEVGREKKYTAIFSKGQILFVAPTIDITDKVLLQLNKKTKNWF